MKLVPLLCHCPRRLKQGRLYHKPIALDRTFFVLWCVRPRSRCRLLGPSLSSSYSAQQYAWLPRVVRGRCPLYQIWTRRGVRHCSCLSTKSYHVACQYRAVSYCLTLHDTSLQPGQIMNRMSEPRKWEPTNIPTRYFSDYRHDPSYSGTVFRVLRHRTGLLWYLDSLCICTTPMIFFFRMRCSLNGDVMQPMIASPDLVYFTTSEGTYNTRM